MVKEASTSNPKVLLPKSSLQQEILEQTDPTNRKELVDSNSLHEGCEEEDEQPNERLKWPECNRLTMTRSGRISRLPLCIKKIELPRAWKENL